MTIVSLAVLVSMNVQLAQSLKVISILSTLMLVQNVVLAQTLVHQKQLAWANELQSFRKYDGDCPLWTVAFFMMSSDYSNQKSTDYLVQSVLIYNKV